MPRRMPGSLGAIKIEKQNNHEKRGLGDDRIEGTNMAFPSHLTKMVIPPWLKR